MPNFNGAIVMHTLQTIKTPATLREIVMTIANKTDLPQDELMKPVKQTLDMGYRLGFLQKVNGRYFVVEITFEMLMEEMKSQGHHKIEILEKPDSTKAVPEKKVKKKQHAVIQKSVGASDSTTTLKPNQSVETRQKRKMNRAQVPIK